MIEITMKASHRGAVIKTRDGREAEAMEMEREGEKSRVEREREPKITMDLVRNEDVKT